MSVKSQICLDELLRLVDDMMRYAYTLEKNSEIAPTILLDSLARTISQHIKSYDMLRRWEQNQPYYDRIRQLHASFLSLAVENDLRLYVAEKLDTRSCSTRSEDPYLICRALWPDVSKIPLGNRAMLDLLLKKGMRMTKVDDSWQILFSEIADGWAQAPDEEKILQLETISALLLARGKPRDSIGKTCWNYLPYTLPENWLSSSIELQQALKTTISLLFETVSDFDPAYAKKMLWRKITSEIFHPIDRLDIGPASKEIILEIIRIFMRHGASLAEGDCASVISALCRDPYFSTEQKAELRAMLPSDSIDLRALPCRRYPGCPSLSSTSNTWRDIGYCFFGQGGKRKK